MNNTYLSNHTLVQIGFYRVEIPSVIVEDLKLNSVSQHYASTCKIHRSDPVIDMEPLLQWKFKCLPLVLRLRWLEMTKSYLDYVNESDKMKKAYLYYTGALTESKSMGCRQLSAIYKFIRGMPQLTVYGYRSQGMNDIESNPKKTKFDRTL